MLSRRDAELAGLIESEPSSAAVAAFFREESIANAARQLGLTGQSPDHLLRDAATAVLDQVQNENLIFRTQSGSVLRKSRESG